MTQSIPAIASCKNEWLLEQVNVQYPTSESLVGRDLYVKSLLEREYHQISKKRMSPVVDEIFLVDFHRLTVMFSVLQAKRWSSESDQANIIEFFTQIILSEQHQLYVGFSDGEPQAVAIYTAKDDCALLSDIYLLDRDVNEREQFAQQLLEFITPNIIDDNPVWLEVE